MSRVVHLRAVAVGAAVALALAVPTALIAQLLDRSGPVDDNSLWLLVLFAVVVASMVTGGYVAASIRPDAPLTNSALAALAAYAIVQSIGVARLLVVGDPITWTAIPFFAFLSSAAGMAGGLVADVRARRPS